MIRVTPRQAQAWTGTFHWWDDAVAFASRMAAASGVRYEVHRTWRGTWRASVVGSDPGIWRAA